MKALNRHGLGFEVREQAADPAVIGEADALSRADARTTHVATAPTVSGDVPLAGHDSIFPTTGPPSAAPTLEPSPEGASQ
jgi:hypothetical protein